MAKGLVCLPLKIPSSRGITAARDFELVDVSQPFQGPLLLFVQYAMDHIRHVRNFVRWGLSKIAGLLPLALDPGVDCYKDER